MAPTRPQSKLTRHHQMANKRSRFPAHGLGITLGKTSADSSEAGTPGSTELTNVTQEHDVLTQDFEAENLFPGFEQDASDEGTQSHFSDSSSSDDEDVSKAIALHNPMSGPTATISWEDLDRLHKATRWDDEDAEESFQAALAPNAPRAEVFRRLESESKRGFHYDNRPHSPLVSDGDDLIRSSLRWARGARLNKFDHRAQAPSESAKGRRSLLRYSKSAEDLSPESSPKPKEEKTQRRRSLETEPRDPVPPMADGSDGDDSDHSASDYEDAESKFGDFQDDGGRGELEPSITEEVVAENDLCTALEALQINTHFEEESKEDSRQSESLSQVRQQKRSPSPTSAEELEFATGLSWNKGKAMLQRMYDVLESVRLETPAEKLRFARQLLDHRRRGLKYNGVDDEVLELLTEGPHAELAALYKIAKAQWYRAQRDEYRNRFHDAEDQLMEKDYEVSMLKHHVNEQDEKLKGRDERLQRSKHDLREKTKEATSWKEAYESIWPLGKVEIERRERLANGEEEVKDAETQTEVLKAATPDQATQAEEQYLTLTTDQTHDLTRENNRLNDIIAKISASNRDLSDRTQELEESVAAEKVELQSSNEDRDRLKSLLTSYMTWHEAEEKEKEEQGNKSAGQVRTVQKSAVSDSDVPAALPRAPQMPLTPVELSISGETADRWRKREERIRNTESFKRNRAAILARMQREEAARRLAGKQTLPTEEELEQMRGWSRE